MAHACDIDEEHRRHSGPTSSFFFARIQRHAADALRCLFGGLLLAWRLDERLVDVWQDTTTCDGGTDQTVQLLVSSDRKLQVSWRDALHTKVLGCVARQFEHLGGEVLQDRRCVDGRLGADSDVVLGAVLQMTVDTTDGELDSVMQPKRESKAKVVSRLATLDRMISPGPSSGTVRLQMCQQQAPRTIIHTRHPSLATALSASVSYVVPAFTILIEACRRA